MFLSSFVVALLALFGLPAESAPQAGFPMMRSIEPDSGKAGDVLAIQGENLGQDNVAALYLTDGKTDIKVLIVEQTATSIKFKIPSEAKTGSFALMVRTATKPPRLIEEPVRVTVVPETSGSIVAAPAKQINRFR